MADQAAHGRGLDFPERSPLGGGGAGTPPRLDARMREVSHPVPASGPTLPDREFTFKHAEFDPGEHYFHAHDRQGDQAGYANVSEKAARGAGGPHVLINKLYVRPGDRGQGIGSRLLEEITGHFRGRELRLKPYPIEDGELDPDELRDFYARRGFDDYVPRGDEGWDCWDYMTRRDPAGPAGPPLTATPPAKRGHPRRGGGHSPASHPRRA